MKNTNIYRAFTIGLFTFASVTSVTGQGLYNPTGRTLTHLQTAWTLEKGSVVFHSNTSSYYKTVLNTPAGAGPASTTFWDVQGNAGLAYASGKHLEWGLSEIVYQDTHKGAGYDLPADLNFNIKFGSIGNIRSHFRYGLLLQGRFPVSGNKNIPFEPYTAGTFEAGLTGLMSYSSDLLIPEAGTNFHINLGMWYFNDVGKFLTDSPADAFAVTRPSRAMIWGFGVSFPANQFDFGIEVFGLAYAVRPPVTAYSREDYIYMTPSVSYRINNRIAFNVGLDVRLSADDEKTDFANTPTQLINSDLPSYPGWRLRFGSKIYLTKPEPREIIKPLFTKRDEQDLELANRENTATMQEMLVKERRKTEVAEEELEQIRNDRKKMEDMLAKLRQLLKNGEGEVTDKNQAEKQVTKKEN
ncbi:MAG TPA: hypothetical protein ENJ29_14630 [Bacteroidetes bacterium]|nr:hypothetical protein [Bacteroidota bacterium]